MEKITNPGLKDIYRVYDEAGKAIADIIANKDEALEGKIRYVDPQKPWKVRYFENCTFVKLQEPAVIGGKRVMKPVPVKEIAQFVKQQLDNEIWEEEQRFENPHIHYLDMTPKYYEMKMTLLEKVSK